MCVKFFGERNLQSIKCRTALRVPLLSFASRAAACRVLKVRSVMPCLQFAQELVSASCEFCCFCTGRKRISCIKNLSSSPPPRHVGHETVLINLFRISYFSYQRSCRDEWKIPEKIFYFWTWYDCLRSVFKPKQLSLLRLLWLLFLNKWQ
jgi:hypothetical protein